MNDFLNGQVKNDGFLRVAAASPQIRVADVEGNAEVVLAAVRDGKVGTVMTPSLRHISRKIEDFLPVVTELRKRKVGLRARDSGALSFPACPMKPPQKKGGEER